MYERPAGLGGLLLRIPALGVVTVFVGVAAFLGIGSGQVGNVESLLTFAFVNTDERVYTEVYPILDRDTQYLGSVFIEPDQVGKPGALRSQQLSDLLVQGWEVGSYVPENLSRANAQASVAVDQAMHQAQAAIGLEPMSLVTRTPYLELSETTVSTIRRTYGSLLPRVTGISNAINTLPLEKYNLKYVDGDQLSASQIESTLRNAREIQTQQGKQTWIIIEFLQVGAATNQKLREIIPVAKALGFHKFVVQQK
ncbi:hypothetical protein HY230_10975 [Candidatus Acetothermia bacterium]|nr:hypothetical protein [Candidatus Acetothermia bacterium]